MPASEVTKKLIKKWEKILRMYKLGMGRGAPNWLSYGHDNERTDEQSCGPQEANIIPQSKPLIKGRGGKRNPPHRKLSQIEKDGFGD